MASRPKLTVIPGGSGGRVQGTFIPTGVRAADGTEYYRPGASSGPPSGGGGDEMKPLWRLDLPRDVQLAKWGVVVLGGLMATMLWFLLSQIDGRFDRADTKVADLSNTVADLRVEIAGQRADIRAVLEKLNDQPQASPPSGQAESVRR